MKRLISIQQCIQTALKTSPKLTDIKRWSYCLSNEVAAIDHFGGTSRAIGPVCVLCVMRVCPDNKTNLNEMTFD